MLSFRRRLALAHFAVIVAVLVLTAFAAKWTLARLVYGQLDAALIELAETEMGMLAAGGPVHVHERPSGPAVPSLIRLDRLVQITDEQGSILARSRNLDEARLPTTPESLSRLRTGETVFETLQGFGEEPVRMVSVPLKVNGSLLVVQVAGSLDDVNSVMSSASVLFVVMGLALLVTVGTAGALLTGRAFRAIDNIVQRARDIRHVNLHERLPHPDTADEIGRLVNTLNGMLERLQQSFDVQRRFTADASHELRSPLSRLRTELEITLRRPRESAEYVQTLRSCLDEVERLTTLVDTLLSLARLDAGQEPGRSEGLIDLNSLAEEVVERARAHARERQVDIELEADARVSACMPATATSLVLANLLDNAVKFSPSGGLVSVGIGADGNDAVVSVSDKGPGIALADLPHIFERFYRGTRARAASAPGVGLGLALSQAIVQTHGGNLQASNLPEGGALFTVRIPLGSPEATQTPRILGGQRRTIESIGAGKALKDAIN